MRSHISRRQFIHATAGAVCAVGAGCGRRDDTPKPTARKRSPNDKLNIACIGVGSQGYDNLMKCHSENVVALCDVDWGNVERVSHYRIPPIPRFTDYRVMLEKMPEIEAVIVATPNHSHAHIAYTAMQHGKHVYVEKPLTHTVAEAQLLMDTAAASGVVTQMGNQGHSADYVRRQVEMIRSGAIGAVREVHCWSFLPDWPQGMVAPLPEQPLPESMHWNLWINGAPMRPYNVGYAPEKWRGWWDFGGGALGDFGCHTLDPVYWALDLGDAPRYEIEVLKQEGQNPQTGPTASVIRYRFPERGNLPPVDVYWHDGGFLPERPAGIPADEILGSDEGGILYVGSEGWITAEEFGQEPRLLPAERQAAYTPPTPTLDRIAKNDHHQNWFAACKGLVEPSAPFSYSGPLTQMVNLGNIALQLNTKIAWDRDRFEILNNDAASRMLSREYREEFALPV